MRPAEEVADEAMHRQLGHRWAEHADHVVLASMFARVIEADRAAVRKAERAHSVAVIWKHCGSNVQTPSDMLRAIEAAVAELEKPA